MAYTRKRSSSRVARRRSVRRRTTAPVRRRKSTRTGRPRRMACHCPGDLSPGAKFALAQLDPYDVKVTGAKIPDSNTIPSISNTDVDLISMTSPATVSWFGATAFRPNFRGGVVIGTATAGGVTWGATYSSNAIDRTKYSQYTSAIELSRPVAHAIRITSQVAPTTATGFVHVGIATESLSKGTWDYPATVAEMAGLQFYRRMTLASLTQTPFTVINKWLDDTGFRYSSAANSLLTDGAAPVAADPGNIYFQTDYGWGAIIVMTEGVPGPSTAVLSCEHLLITEGIPKRTGVLIGTQAATSSPGTMSAVNHVSVNSEPFHSESEQDSYISRGIDLLAQGAAQAGAVVYESVAAPLLQQAGRVAVNSATRYAMNALIGVGGIAGVNSNPTRLSLMH